MCGSSLKLGGLTLERIKYYMFYFIFYGISIIAYPIYAKGANSKKPFGQHYLLRGATRKIQNKN